MKINKKNIIEKCKHVKFHASIKYMAHILKGSERTKFIKLVCDHNIYLACICSRTCEKDIEVEKYIWKCLNNYFAPKWNKYFNKTTGEWSVGNRKIKKDDISNYLLACYEMGNIKAIKWYIYNNEVDKSILYELGKNFQEDELVDLLFTLYSSQLNWNKLKGIGSTKNLFLYKNDKRVCQILRGLWDKDKDAFIQLAYDTGWLGELHHNSSIGEKIYIRCLHNANKLVPALELMADALNDFENSIVGIQKLQDIITCHAKTDERDYLYLIYLIKFNRGYIFTQNDYIVISTLGSASVKIKNYYIKFFLSLVSEDFTDKVNYFEIAYACKNIIGKPQFEPYKIGNDLSNWRIFKKSINSYPDIELNKIIFFYMRTTMDIKVTLDTLISLVNTSRNESIENIIESVNAYPIWARVNSFDSGVYELTAAEIRTKNYLILSNYNTEVGTKLMVSIKDYDYINKVFYVEVLKNKILAWR